MRNTTKTIGAITAGIIAVGLVGVGGASAGSLINSSDIKDDAVRSVDVHDGTVRLKDLTPLAVTSLKGQTGATGATGAKGATGPQGVKGDKGDPGKDAPAAQYGVATVNVSRGGAPATAWATYSTALGSPVGDTTSGSFRFTCSDANAPCTVAVKAAVLSTGTGSGSVYPRVMISRQDYNAGGPSTFCEYGDGSTDAAPASITKQAPSATPTYSAMQVNIGGTADCGGPVTTAGNVNVITVPSGYYDVTSTFVFLP